MGRGGGAQLAPGLGEPEVYIKEFEGSESGMRLQVPGHGSSE